MSFKTCLEINFWNPIQLNFSCYKKRLHVKPENLDSSEKKIKLLRCRMAYKGYPPKKQDTW